MHDGSSGRSRNVPPRSTKAWFFSTTFSSPIGFRLRRHKLMLRSTSADEPTIRSPEPA
jgi:hypothetical protein